MKESKFNRVNPAEHTNHNNGSYHAPKGDSGNFIQKAVKHPGVEKAAAKKAGVTTHQYMEQHKNDPGTAGKRARLGLTLEGMSKKSEPDGDEGKYSPKPSMSSNPSLGPIASANKK